MSNWQPIETAPKDVRVLVFRPSAEIYDGPFEASVEFDIYHSKAWTDWGSSNNEPGWGDCHPYLGWPEPTHWMPSPAFPGVTPEPPPPEDEGGVTKR